MLHLLGVEYHPASPETDSESLFTLPGQPGGVSLKLAKSNPPAGPVGLADMISARCRHFAQGARGLISPVPRRCSPQTSIRQIFMSGRPAADGPLRPVPEARAPLQGGPAGGLFLPKKRHPGYGRGGRGFRKSEAAAVRTSSLCTPPPAGSQLHVQTTGYPPDTPAGAEHGPMTERHRVPWCPAARRNRRIPSAPRPVQGPPARHPLPADCCAAW